jgi:hypothetical protein
VCDDFSTALERRLKNASEYFSTVGVPQLSKGAPNGDQDAKRHALLIAFGGLEFSNAGITADRLYESLISRGVWLTSRVPTSVQTGTDLLFYQSRRGFRGTATLAEVSQTMYSDWQLPGDAFRLFPIKLMLTNVHTFAKPLEMKPLANALSFVPNKKYWGQAVQNTPRIIPLHDFKLIVTNASLGKPLA